MSTIKIVIRPSKITGEIRAPPSKSCTHRAIICASLADGLTAIINPLLSDDTEATLRACAALGAEILEKNSEKITIRGNRGKVKAKEIIDCAESGSTLRFMLPVAAMSNKEVIFTGKEGLKKRPIKDFLAALRETGAKIEHAERSGLLPMKILGGNISGLITIRGDISSQFISGLLLALPLAKGDSEIQLTTRLESRDYVELTLDVLEQFGIRIRHSKDLKKFRIDGNQKYRACKFIVEGDHSSAAFMLAAGALSGAVTVTNLNTESKQGDRRIIDILQSMGAKVNIGKNSISVEKSDLRGVSIDARDIPDLVPIVSVIATQANGTTKIKNVERLRMKESNRLAGITDMLKKLGATVSVKCNSIEIEGKTKLVGNEVETLADHRLVMAASVAGLVAEGETIVNGPTAIKKSYPAFFDDFRRLGADVMSMSDVLGSTLKIRMLGESHGKRIGVILEGVPKNLEISRNFIQSELEKRRSTTALSTARRERDIASIVSGIERRKTTGETIRLEIENKDVVSEQYEGIKDLPRPGHADYPARVKYASVFDQRGGGFLSGRMTACQVAAGAVAKKIFEKLGIQVLAHTVQIGNVKVTRKLSNEELESRFLNPVRCADSAKAKKMEMAVEKVKNEGDSVGGIIECRVLNLPVGVGEPPFQSLESRISQAMFSIPAVKGVEFGTGFAAANMRGSESNDPLKIEGGRVVTTSNNSGGIQGGLSNGMPVTFRVVVKPTPSIFKRQRTVDLRMMRETDITIHGRHDPCIVMRAVPVVEAMTAIAVADLLLAGGFLE
ncbi:3-phosphoshikimate 1-carboxyvinyltransferase [Candidatus Micrarchaeota archaeon]|nr:3-phosphoshikimate 1-carboxyvinyltransferase [Candidatus Micrarchaeota archaeon]